MTRRQVLALVALVPLQAHSAERVRVGKTHFRVERGTATGAHAQVGRRYLHIHGNETTARVVLAKHVARRSGVAVFVEESTRTISVDGLIIDPNRMFSRVGAEASLRRLNPRIREAALSRALARLERELPALLRVVLPPAGGLLISIHNNSQGYNIQQEIPLSEQHHLPVPDEPNNFFLATDERDYVTLARGPFNAVLQMNPAGPDDGSLSRLCALRGIRYVNLEAILGAAERQHEMLVWLDDALPALYGK
ncbi:MAG: hypothetical protein KIT83_01610 [Bryobacterales bacterium]|nr:hypothetical protein [Bryobacterales bacterium]